MAIWINKPKNSARWGSRTKNISVWANKTKSAEDIPETQLLIDDSFSLLIDDTFSLVLQSASQGTVWKNMIKH